MDRNQILGIILAIFIVVLVVLALAILFFFVVKYKKELTALGRFDEQLKKERLRSEKKCFKVLSKVGTVFTYLICGFLLSLFAVSLVSCATGNNISLFGVSSAHVVVSGSMSEKHPGNTYLKENNLNDQFQVYDIVLTQKMPKEEELKLYDVVVYEADGKLYIHRIIGIEEPNQSHPNEKRYFFRGDANNVSDKYSVSYNQMKGIYKGQNIPYLGMFVLFFQSTLGYIAIGIIVFYCVVVPILEHYLEKEEKKRLAILFPVEEQPLEQPVEENTNIIDVPVKSNGHWFMKMTKKTPEELDKDTSEEDKIEL